MPQVYTLICPPRATVWCPWSLQQIEAAWKVDQDEMHLTFVNMVTDRCHRG